MDDTIFLLVVLYIAYNAIKERLEDAKKGGKTPRQGQGSPPSIPRVGQGPRQSAGDMGFQIPRIEGAPPSETGAIAIAFPEEEAPQDFPAKERPALGAPPPPKTPRREAEAPAKHPLLKPGNALAAVVYAEILGRPKARRRRRR